MQGVIQVHEQQKSVQVTISTMLTSKTKHKEKRRDESFQPNPTFSTQRKSSVTARGCVLNFAYRLVNSILNLPTRRPIFFFWRGRGNSILAGQEFFNDSQASICQLLHALFASCTFPNHHITVGLCFFLSSLCHLLFNQNEVRCTSQTHQ